MEILFTTRSKTLRATIEKGRDADALAALLPLHATIQRWGAEIYFEIPRMCVEGTLTMDVSTGDIAYWPTGSCLCIFFGPTPMSTDDKPVPASGVSILGRTEENPALLNSIKNGESITVTQGACV